MARETTTNPAPVGPWPGAFPSAWLLNSDQSTFAFRVKHFWGLMTVQGHFERFEGQAQVDAAGTAVASIRIEATSLDTKKQQRDKHLRSADFFGVEQFPTVTFTTQQVAVLSAGRLKVEGELTAAGRSRPLTFEARFTAGANRVIVDAEASVDRTAFGMTWSPLHMASATAVLVVHAQFDKKGS